VLEHKAGYHGIPEAEAERRAEEALKPVGIYQAEQAECLGVVRKSQISVMTRCRRRLEPLDPEAVHLFQRGYGLVD
jgi:hypothetical protein